MEGSRRRACTKPRYRAESYCRRRTGTETDCGHPPNTVSGADEGTIPYEGEASPGSAFSRVPASAGAASRKARCWGGPEGLPVQTHENTILKLLLDRQQVC